jgi:hypothetical protein
MVFRLAFNLELIAYITKMRFSVSCVNSHLHVHICVTGSQFYIKKPASGSPIGTAFRVCLEAVRTWNRRRKRDVELFVRFVILFI